MACGRRLASVREEGHARRRCPRCGWTFYNNPVPAVLGIAERGGRVLLARRAAPPYEGTWDLPGGFLEAGETPERALLRELREELGVGTLRPRFIGFFVETYGAGGMPVLVAVYRVRLTGEPRAMSDVAEVRWFPRRRLPLREIAFPAMRRAVRAYGRGATRLP
ncbi:MAG: NUDIX domain-containing protein [Candidatus Rokubacteria bacterium]|nr:NUDIX domain-containing protein [Candidatus Rokubacteria bacterium]